MHRILTLIIAMSSFSYVATAQRLPDNTWAECFEMVGKLVLNGPRPEMHVLGEWVREHKPAIDFTSSISGTAETMDDARTTMAFGMLNSKKLGTVPVLMIHSGYILGPHSNEAKYLTLWHEFDHIVQWRAGKISDRLLMLLDDEAEARLTAEELRTHLEYELHAYFKEGQLAAEVGWLDHYKYGSEYRSVGLAGVAKAVADFYESTSLYAKVRTQVHTWAGEYVKTYEP